jgi:hypothetical protein
VDVVITTRAERPELTDPLRRMINGWPEFMLHDPVSEAYFGRLPDTFPHFTLAG